jgi:phage/plasmid-like protein (TIGR03299 family)
VAHELDRNLITGQKAMFSVRETPWHREGIILNDAPSMAEAMRLAGCDFDVETRPIFISDGVGGFVESAEGKAIVRTDRNVTLGNATLAVVGNSYVPLQNADAFGVLEPLLDKGVAHLETGGTLRDGKDAWMLVRFDIDDPVVREVFAAEVIPFGLITNNHSGEARALVMQTPVRVVCANTLGAALSNLQTAIKVGHRGDAKVRMVDAAEQMFAGLVDRYRSIAESYRALRERILTVDEFTKHVLDVAAPLPPKAFTVEGNHLTSRGYDAAYEAADTRRIAIRQAWTNGIGHTGEPNAWYAYNAAVEVIDHDEKLYRTRGSRVAALIGGRLVAAKTGVLNELVALTR